MLCVEKQLVGEHLEEILDKGKNHYHTHNNFKVCMTMYAMHDVILNTLP